MSNVKEDFLEVDNRIPGQNYCCLSFLSPEKVMKKKEVFFVTKFMHYLLNDQERAIKEAREKLLEEKNVTYKTISELYADWKFNRTNDLELEFSEINDYATSMRGVKVRGTYESLREAKRRAEMLRKRDPNFHVFVGQVGYWLPWDPEASDVQDQEYQEGELNELMKKYQENAENRDFMYEQDREERVQKAREEVRRRRQEQERLRREEAVKEPLRLDNENQAVEKIGNLREILNEIDENVYETEQAKIQAEKDRFEARSQSGQETIEDVTDQLEKDIVDETNRETQNTLNNFASGNMEKLEEMDPWLKRKMAQKETSSSGGGAK